MGPARAVALSAVGAVALTGSEELAVASLRDGNPAPLPDPQQREAFFAAAVVGDGPANAYWVSRGRLVTRSIERDGSVGALEVLAKGVAKGTAVAASRSAGSEPRDVVLHISDTGGEKAERSARLWVRGHGTHALPMPPGATNVAAVRLGTATFSLLVLDGRQAMSSVHAIDLKLDGDGRPRLGPDRVVYVAGGVEWYTALSAVRASSGPVALIPLAKDITQFGLVTLRIAPGEAQAAESWVDYPNGIDPAPVAAARICERPAVAFVQPESSAAGAAQIVRLGHIDAAGRPSGLRTVASAKVITYVGLGAAPGSGRTPRAGGRKETAGWLAYATDAGLWAKALTCD